jgi:hypothetical protein
LHLDSDVCCCRVCPGTVPCRAAATSACEGHAVPYWRVRRKSVLHDHVDGEKRFSAASDRIAALFSSSVAVVVATVSVATVSVVVAVAVVTVGCQLLVVGVWCLVVDALLLMFGVAAVLPGVCVHLFVQLPVPGVPSAARYCVRKGVAN